MKLLFEEMTFEILTTKNFFAKKASKFCTVTTSKLTGNLPPHLIKGEREKVISRNEK